VNRVRVLVTGASGFLGGHLCRRLHERGAKVIGVSRVPRGDPPFVEWLADDLARPDAVARLLEAARPDVVYHLAGHAHAATGLELVEPTFESILVTTKNLLLASARGSRPRILLPGSLEEPGDGGGVPASPYAAARSCAAAYGRMFQALYGVPVVNLRIFMTYGPGQLARKVVPYVITSFLRGEAPELASGSRPVDWIYVDDVVDGMIAAATASGIEGATVDLGSGALVTVRELVEEIERLVRPAQAPRFAAVSDRAGETTRAADIEATRKLLGWEARTPLVEGLARTVAWYRERLAAGPRAGGES
jgi:nucleoside-diphosphate-sugar epimerase